MAERYTKIYAQEGMRYLPGAPALLAAGALLRDGYSNELLCQLKIRSLSEQKIKAVTVRLQMLDIAGAPISPLWEHQYLDLQVERDGEFGRDTAIILPRRDARAFTAEISEVIFEDNSRWHPEEGAEWHRIQPPQPLAEAYGDPELAEQFRIRYGADCRDHPLVVDDLWFCTCGACNRETEHCCYRCRRVLSALLDVNTEALHQEVISRRKQEAVQQEQDKEEAKQRNRKYLKIACVIVPLLILAIGLGMTIPRYVRQKQTYDAAVSLLLRHQYEQATELFTSLGGYRDSAEQAAKNVPYQRAMELIGAAEENDAAKLRMVGHSRADLSEDVTAAMLLYEGAIRELEALDGYKDSEAQILRCEKGIEKEKQAQLQEAYDQAVQLLDAGQYSAAREAFLVLGGYSDSADLAKEAVYRKAYALYEFICSYDVRQIYADLSMSPDRGSAFSLPKDKALELGSKCIADLRAACGEDLVDVVMADKHAESMRPLADCVTELFVDLEGYADSADCIAGIADATDYTKDFYMLLEAGEIYGAYDWLRSYEGSFADRDRWLGLLDLYKPYCAGWTLHGGDITVIPLTAGRGSKCENCSTRVIIQGDRVTLRLSANDGEEYFVDFGAKLGATDFSIYDLNGYNYLLAITAAGHLSYMQYSSSGKLLTSCEYKPS